MLPRLFDAHFIFSASSRAAGLGLYLLASLAASMLWTTTLRADSLSTQLPNIGDAGMATLSPAEERQLGREFMRSARNSLDIMDDPLATEYLQGLADRLVSHYQYHDQTIRVFIVNDSSINAFAGPGGYIGVHAGLIMTSQNEAELASVMAHEIAHVVQRHLVRRFEAGSKLALPTMGAMLAAILVGGSNPQAAQALISGAVAGSIQEQLSYSRENEQEADRIGLDLLAGADYNPRAMPAFFEALQQRQRIGASSAPEYFRTHPLTTSRIADTRNRAEQLANKGQTDNIQFQLFKARIASLSPTSVALTSYAQTINANTLPPQAQQYYQALSDLKGDQPDRARNSLARLRQNDPHSVIFPYSAAEAELADGKPETAREQLETALRLFPGNIPLTVIYARTLLRLEQPEQAFKVLRNLLPRLDEQAEIYALYARAADDAGQPGEGYRALAEMNYAQGNTRQAADYLEQALKLDTISPRERLIYQARLDSWQEELKALKKTP